MSDDKIKVWVAVHKQTPGKPQFEIGYDMDSEKFAQEDVAQDVVRRRGSTVA